MAQAKVYTEEQKLEFVRAVDAHRAAHPSDTIQKSLRAAARGISQSNYYNWRAVFSKNGVIEPLPNSEKISRAAKGARRSKTNGRDSTTTEFPLAMIPEREPARTRTKRAAIAELVPRQSEQGKVAAFLRALVDLLT